MSKKEKQTLLSCPKCGATDVLVMEEAAFYANTGEFYCHSVKSYDEYARATCPICWWEGQRKDLIKKEVE